jgi:hypothetical protein
MRSTCRQHYGRRPWPGFAPVRAPPAPPQQENLCSYLSIATSADCVCRGIDGETRRAGQPAESGDCRRRSFACANRSRCSCPLHMLPAPSPAAPLDARGALATRAAAVCARASVSQPMAFSAEEGPSAAVRRLWCWMSHTHGGWRTQRTIDRPEAIYRAQRHNVAHHVATHGDRSRAVAPAAPPARRPPPPAPPPAYPRAPTPSAI